MMDNLNLEAEAFDRQILERVAHGHIPDLRHPEKCEYFYNNVWHYPYMVKMDFGEIFEIIRDQIHMYTPKPNASVLEVGCGPGFMSLELARSGFEVTGIDLSPYCIDIATNFADKDPYKAERGNLRYIAGDFFTNKDIAGTFDAIVFVGALHHFPDQEQVLGRASDLLKQGGIVVVHEPTRDRVTEANAAISELVKSLLSLTGGYYKNSPSFKSTADISKAVDAAFTKMRYETEEGEKAQSVNDNSSGWAQMVPALRAHFTELNYKDRYAFYHELIGGLRFSDEKNEEIANTIRLFDKFLCETGVIQPTEFLFTGRRS